MVVFAVEGDMLDEVDNADTAEESSEVTALVSLFLSVPTFFQKAFGRPLVM